MEDGACASVSVYDLTNPASSRTHVTKAPNRCTFLLPESDWVDSIYVRCNPSSLRQSVLAYSSSEDLPDSVVTICAYCHADTHSTETAVKIFMPASRLRARIAAATPGQRLAWHEWGLTDAHVEVDAGPYFAEARSDSVAGMRAVDLSADFTQLCVYDFEPSRISRYFHRTDPEVLKCSKDHAARDATLVGLPSIELLDWNARALKMFVPVSDWNELGSASLSVLKTSIELPEQLRGLDFDIWKTLITDDAIVILNPVGPSRFILALGAR
ncbi:hypothetical protein EWM64_g10526 [Hericium alpestre]|uniref:Uncharacterized protein n=1 Tax=Hericium alpestre TaxID=135208 RepID=A0A4Y9ZHK0_9AGAM|nr:hypothetical protein EWM64_g10526 [Hericium alpestre]